MLFAALGFMLPPTLMRILVFHGYLLRGTGSNVYNAELARALTAAGHDVHLLAQDRAPEDLDFVTAVGAWDTGSLVIKNLSRKPTEGHGTCTVYRPPIADLLPVYVADAYEGFVAKTFDQLDDEELEFYINRNVMAVKAVAKIAEPDCALANHMVMGPLILARALAGTVPYAAKIHGSAMEYTVRRFPRFLPYAIEGVGSAQTMLVGSRHIAERAWDTLGIDGLEARTYLGPPGVDTDRFRPKLRTNSRGDLGFLINTLQTMPRDGYGASSASAVDNLVERLQTAARTEGTTNYEEIAQEIAAIQGTYDTSGIDVDAAASAQWIAESGEDPIALFVGKLIVSKGVDLLLAAWPLVRQRHPNARLAIVGFGAYREGLELMLSALSAGDLVTARWIAMGGRQLEIGTGDEPLNKVVHFFDSLDEDQRAAYVAAAQGMRESVRWFGRLEHEQLVDLIPTANCQVIPSTFPEAFGMVAAEAAACGVPPISAEHSGLKEVSVQLQENLSGASASLLSFPTDDLAVDRLASRLSGVFGQGLDERREMAARLVATAVSRFSWDGVAANVVAAATGETSSLRRP